VVRTGFLAQRHHSRIHGHGAVVKIYPLHGSSSLSLVVFAFRRRTSVSRYG
jgi:hypothetical protein